MPLQLVIVVGIVAALVPLWGAPKAPFAPLCQPLLAMFRVAGIVNAFDFLPLWPTNSSRACRPRKHNHHYCCNQHIWQA